jgi:putative ubiquitin-RnfH superfamily antitoxin RatB of RatAB toxin-antitoxin module
MAEIDIEVAYVSKERQFLKTLRVPAGTRLSQAISLSGLLDAFPELELSELTVGIFAKKLGLDQVVKDGDRVEVYRPLEVDPKDARRARARRSKP